MICCSFRNAEDRTDNLTKHTPATVKLYESPSRAGGLPTINHPLINRTHVDGDLSRLRNCANEQILRIGEGVVSAE